MKWQRKKRELHPDLPPRSDPNYGRLYDAKMKDRRLAREQFHKERKEQFPEEYAHYKQTPYDPLKAKTYREENKARLKEAAWQAKGIVGLTYERYLADLEAQEGKCKICEKEMNPPHADHDHETGCYRGLLCIACNNGLGIYEKNKERFERYLNEPK